MVKHQAAVLLVEDDSNDVLLLQRALRRAHLSPRLVIVPDGEEAIRYLQGTGTFSDRQQFPTPSVILLDLRLPRRHGFEVLEWVHRDAHFKHLPVVVISSSDQGRDVQLACDLGAIAYIRKTSSFEPLVNKLQQLLEPKEELQPRLV